MPYTPHFYWVFGLSVIILYRHSYASILIATGANVKDVQDALGHASSRMTLDTYAQSFAEARAKAMQAVSLSITDGDEILKLT